MGQQYIGLTGKGYLFAKPSGLVLGTLGLLDLKVRLWRFYFKHRKRLTSDCFILGIVSGFIPNQFIDSLWWVIVCWFVILLIGFSWLPSGNYELERFGKCEGLVSSDV